MSKLSKETRERIEADSISWSENQYGHDDVNKDYLEGALHAATGQFWDDDKTRPMSYGACYGSNGERDFMRNIANEALNGEGEKRK